MELRQLTLTRTTSNDQGTRGVLTENGERIADTLELPWRGNKRRRSCIPTGNYRCTRIQSPRFGNTYEITDVKNRTHILFHAGNWAGDKKHGYRTDSSGCILLGKTEGKLKNQRAVLSSRLAVKAFKKQMKQQDFLLTIIYA